jgi:hypothetical protein
VLQFRDLVKSRNTDIQDEYARMLKELDDQTESLDQEIAKQREIKADRSKRRREEAFQRKAGKKQRLEEDSSQLKVQLDDVTSEIRQLQEVFATLEKDGDEADESGQGEGQTAEERRRQDEEQAQNDIVELQQEIVLLKEAQEAIAEKIDVRVLKRGCAYVGKCGLTDISMIAALQRQSLKAQYEEEKQEVLEETAHVRIWPLYGARSQLSDWRFTNYSSKVWWGILLLKSTRTAFGCARCCVHLPPRRALER